MKKWLPLVVLILIAGALRLYKIGTIPFGFNWDETSITYNAWGISLWYRDEWAEKLPLAFRSFGDYKAPLLFYLLAVPFKVFGLWLPLIRVMSALFGIGLVVVTYYTANLLFKSEKKIGFIAGLLVALSPWAINFSRVGFEANISLTLVSLGVLFFLKGLTNAKMQAISALFFALSMYAYHSAKITTPLILGILAWLYSAHIQTSLKSIVLLALALSPLVYSTFFGHGFERGLTMIFFDTSHQLRSISEIVTEFVHNVGNQVSLKFMIGGIDAVGLRHLTPGYGIIYAIELPFLLLGLAMLVRKKSREGWLLIGWFFAGMLPAILSHQTPHAVRSILMMPALQLLTAYGFVRCLRALNPQAVFIRKIATIIPAVVLLLSVCGYLRAYYTTYAIDSSYDFQYGYGEALEIARDLGRTRDKIIVTDVYGQPYVYVLLTNRITPQEFLSGALANYEFHSFSWPYGKPNSVVVGTPKEIPVDDPAVENLVKIPGTNEVVFVIATTPK
jgi:hypothetical protein